MSPQTSQIRMKNTRIRWQKAFRTKSFQMINLDWTRYYWVEGWYLVGMWQAYTWYWDQYSLVENWYYLNSLPGYWYEAGIAWDHTSLTSSLIQRPILVYILGFQPGTPPSTSTNSKPIFTPFSNLYFIRSRVGWIFVVLVRLCVLLLG
jgi:hypothetical protein